MRAKEKRGAVIVYGAMAALGVAFVHVLLYDYWHRCPASDLAHVIVTPRWSIVDVVGVLPLLIMAGALFIHFAISFVRVGMRRQLAEEQESDLRGTKECPKE